MPTEVDSTSAAPPLAPSPSSPPLIILAIETSTMVARVAVVDGRTGVRLAAAEAVAARHSSNLLRLCVETTEKARVSIAGLGAIACGAGPGSFTGLRVGLAVAKGLAMPMNIPFVMVSSLEALALDMLAVAAPSARAGELLLPCLDAGKGQVFAALFRAREHTDSEGAGVEKLGDDWALVPALLPEQIAAAADRAPVFCAGPGADRYRDILAGGFGERARFAEISGPSAEAVATRALVKLARGEVDDLAGAVPAYGRPPDITQPKRSVR